MTVSWAVSRRSVRCLSFLSLLAMNLCLRLHRLSPAAHTWTQSVLDQENESTHLLHSSSSDLPPMIKVIHNAYGLYDRSAICSDVAPA
jgi:hypothetical protein